MTYDIKLTFEHDDGCGAFAAKITVPGGVTQDDVLRTLRDAHKYLTSERAQEDGNDVYGTEGEAPENLLAYACEANGWQYRPLVPRDILELVIEC